MLNYAFGGTYATQGREQTHFEWARSTNHNNRTGEDWPGTQGSRELEGKKSCGKRTKRTMLSQVMAWFHTLWKTWLVPASSPRWFPWAESSLDASQRETSLESKRCWLGRCGKPGQGQEESLEGSSGYGTSLSRREHSPCLWENSDEYLL